MKTWNIVLGGVGGQGMVLTTKIICDAANEAGCDVKSNDVVGLSQRGGKIWGSVRIGDRIHSPNIPPRAADIIVGLEPLEALRWRGMVKSSGWAFVNLAVIPPVPVIHEKVAYPTDIIEQLKQCCSVFSVNANEMAKSLGQVKVANTILLGKMSTIMDLPESAWIHAIERNVPPKSIEINIRAFQEGRNLKG